MIESSVRWILAFVAALVAVILVAPLAAAATPGAPSGASLTCDSHGATATAVVTAAERGPPAGLYQYTTYDAVDRRSDGASVRPDRATPSAAITYTHHTPLVQVAGAAAMTQEQAGVSDGCSAVFDRGGVAAKSADEAADIGHAGLRHQFPNTLKGKSQFYDDIDLGGLASRTKGMDGFLQTNGNTRYVLRNPGGVGVDRTTGLPTDVFTVVRRPDGSVVTMFPGTSPKG